MTDEIPLQEIAREIAKVRFYHALVRCWHLFRHNNPAFRKAEQQALNNPESYEQHKKELTDIVDSRQPVRIVGSNQALKITDFIFEYPLAILEVLDQLLWERHGLKRQTAPGKVLIGERGYFIHRRALAHAIHSRYVKQTGHMQRWLRHHWIIPSEIEGVQIQLKPTAFTQASFDYCLESGALRVFVSSFPDGVMPAWNKVSSDGLIARKLDDPAKRRTSVRKAFQQAIEAKADIVVFPELTLCPILRNEVSVWLEETEDHPFVLVLPGSFHQEISGRVYNYAELFSRTGKPILSHRKLTTSVLQAGREATTTGCQIELLDTSIGLIGIPICLDFCEGDSPFNHLWSEIGAEWLLVPAYGPATSIHAHKRRAQDLLRSHGAVTAVANQNPSGEDKDHGFVCHLDGDSLSHGVDDCQGSCISAKLIKKT